MQLSVRKWRFNEPVHVGIEKPLLFRQMLVRRYGDAHGQVDSFEAERNSKVPFRYLDMWSGGLIEQGSSLGFNAQRFGNT